MGRHDDGISYWQSTASVAERPALAQDLAVDVCVIGAGIAGLSTAYRLAQEGRTVAVLEDGAVGSGMTAFTTAHLTNVLDDRYYEIERLHGEDGARAACASHTAAIEFIARTVAGEGIDCDFTRLDGYLFAPPGDDGDELDRELAAMARAGLHDATKVARAPLATFDTGPALRVAGQAQCHPLKYLAGLARAVERLGGRIFCNTHAAAVHGGRNAGVATARGPTVQAAAIVVATNVPINDRLVIHTKQAPYTTYVVGLEVDAGAVVPALYWDTRQSADDPPGADSPYHYARLARAAKTGRDVLVVGGEDHKSGQADDGDRRFARLEAWTRERWAAGDVAFRWSGQVMEPNDGMAFIGRNPLDHDNVYVVTGDSGNGMTHGTLAGLLITDLLDGRDNRWQRLYDPGRIRLRGTSDFVRENANVATEYAKGYLGPGEVGDVDAIAPGQGGVVRRGLRKVAVFRDDGGVLHERSAVCPHLGCIVAWNHVESTWDCPCHGSRFDRFGEVVNGPANRALAPVGETR